MKCPQPAGDLRPSAAAASRDCVMLITARFGPIANKALGSMAFTFRVATATGSPSTNSIGPTKPPWGSSTDARKQESVPEHLDQPRGSWG